MKACIFIVLIFFSGWSAAQTIKGLVVDADEKPVEFAEIFDTISGTKTISNQSGFFELEISGSCALEISHPLYVTEFFKLSDSDITNEVKVYSLNERIQLVEGVTITSERMETVVDQRNINVVDYLPFDNALLVLKSHKGKRLLSIEGQDTTYRTLEIGKLKPKEIFLDCFENIHLLSHDSSYQITLDTTVSIVARSSIKEFDYLVKPCVADYDHSRVFGNFSDHNKKYTLTSINDETKAKEHFLHIYDKIGKSVARTCYYEIIGRYFAVTPEHENIIKDGAWSGDVMELPSLDHHLDRMIAWYVNVRATELNVQSFQHNNLLFNVDQYSDSIRVYNELNQLIYSEKHDFFKSKRVHDVLLDRTTGALYEQFIENGVYSVRQISMDERAIPKSLKLDEVPFCKNIQIHNDWVYFMIEQNGFYQVNRILLKQK